MPIQTYPTVQKDIQQLVLAPEAENELLTQLYTVEKIHTSYLFGTYDASIGSAFVSVVLPLPTAGMDAQVYAKGGLDVFRQFCSDAQCLGMWMRTADLKPVGIDALLTSVDRHGLKNDLLLGVGQLEGSVVLSAVSIGAAGASAALPIVVDG